MVVIIHIQPCGDVLYEKTLPINKLAGILTKNNPIHFDLTYPKRHRNHEIEELSERYLRNSIPASWVTNKLQLDYGTDYNCEITLDNGVSGLNFSIQLKGKEIEKHNKYAIIAGIKRTTINRWLRKLEPTMIVAYIVDENEAYWTWFTDNTFDLTKNNKTYQIKIPKENKLSLIDWDTVQNYLKKVFSRKHLLYKYPSPRISANEGWALFFQRKFESALGYLKELSKTKNEAIVWNVIAVCYYEMYQYKNALININKAIELSNSKELLLNKASFLTEQGRIEKDRNKLFLAMDIYHELIYSDYDNFYLFYNYANALSLLNEHYEAIYQFREALRINPNYAQAWKNLGTEYFYLSKHKEELKCYDKALLIEPNLAEALFSKGLTLYNVFKEVDKGLELMIKGANQTDRFEHEFPMAFYWIAEGYLKKNDIDLAEAWNIKGLQNNPTHNFLTKQRTEIEKLKNAR